MKLNLGSGSKRYDGFINIDQDPGSQPDHVVDLETQALPFLDNTVSHVLAHHVLEHMGNGFFNCIKEIYRVCQPGAILEVHVPHPRHDTFLIDPTHQRSIMPDTMAMFSKKRNRNDIKAGGCETPLGFIHNVDFECVGLDYVLDPYFQQVFKNLQQHECEQIVRTCNNVILEIKIKMMVMKNDFGDR